MKDTLEFIWKTLLSFGELQVQEIETFKEKMRPVWWKDYSSQEKEARQPVL